MFKFKTKKLNTNYYLEPDEVILDSMASKKQQELGIPEMRLETPLSRRILSGLLAAIFILLFLLLFKSFQLQVIEGSSYFSLSQKNRFAFKKITAERGVIYDNKGKQLVWNRSSFDLTLNKRELPQEAEVRDRILDEVSEILQKDIRKIIEEKKDSEITVDTNIPLDILIALESKIEELKGFRIQNNSIREYKEGPAFSHLLGYMGKINKEEFNSDPDFYTIFDWVGKAGLEKYYENTLRKDPGIIRVEKSALGRIISQDIVSLPKSGNSLVLWLDADLQKKAYEVLEKKVSEIGAKGGAVIVLNSKNGGVLSLVSVPSFDNNLFQEDSDKLALLLKDLKEPLFNRAVSGRYLVGSTIKPLIALAALEEKIIDPDKKIYSKGYIEIPHRYNPDIIYTIRDWTAHGWVDMKKAIAQSSNVYFYAVGGGYGDQKGLGPNKIKKYLDLFGWTKKTGIDLSEEAVGFVPDPEWKKQNLKEGWWDGDTYFLSIGQQYLKITPLEVASSFVAIANGGRLLKPQIVKQIIDNDKNIIQEFPPQVIKENFVSPENIRIVKEGMRRAVSGEDSPLASAILFNSLPVRVAAKTGTAELGNNYFNNWVTVFAPYDDPEIVMTVMIENIKGAQRVALPVAKEILEWYFSEERNR